MIRCIGFDPGIKNLAYVVCDDSMIMLPLVIAHRMVDLGHLAPAAEAYDLVLDLALEYGNVSEPVDSIQGVPVVGVGADLIVGIETYRHRRWLGRAITSAPEMGAVVAGIELAARGRGMAVYQVEPADHRGTIPRTVYPKALRNEHLRDAFGVAVAAIGHHRLAKIKATSRRGDD